MDGRTDRQTDGRTDGQTDGRTDGRMDRQTDGPTNGRTDGRMDQRTDGQTDPLIEMRGRIYKNSHMISVFQRFLPISTTFPGQLISSRCRIIELMTQRERLKLPSMCLCYYRKYLHQRIEYMAKQHYKSTIPCSEIINHHAA